MLKYSLSLPLSLKNTMQYTPITLEYSTKEGIYKQGREFMPETNHVGFLILNFQPPNFDIISDMTVKHFIIFC